MARCPVCDSPRVVIVLSPARRSFCMRCGSRWIQEGSVQRSVHRAEGVDSRGRRVIRLTDAPRASGGDLSPVSPVA